MPMNKSLLMIIALFLPMSVFAQNMLQSQVQLTHESMRNAVKGTLDGPFIKPRKLHNKIRQFVFPRSINGNFSSNPWSKQQMQPKRNQRGYSNIPKGNPWAPVGDTQNIPFDKGNFTGLEKNPYTDSRPPLRAPINQFPPFNGGYNQPSFNSYNGAFSSPFGNNFFPSNQFWPNGNNNGSSPFMPW